MGERLKRIDERRDRENERLADNIDDLGQVHALDLPLTVGSGVANGVSQSLQFIEGKIFVVEERQEQQFA
jgi:hypothetical protein